MQFHPHWQRQFDWDFGTPLGPYQKEITAGRDTLYVRLFSKGMVEVNPYDRYIRGVPWLDSRFSFWVPVTDLSAEALDSYRISAAWTAPDGQENDPDYVELRYSTEPITVENFESAAPFSGNPIYKTPGTQVGVTIDNLVPGTTYYLAIRSHTSGRPEPLISPVVSATTPIRGQVNLGSDGASRKMLPAIHPSRTGLTAIAPNPARRESSIAFAITPQAGPVSLSIHDVGGRLVRTLVDGLSDPGRHSRLWDGRDALGTPVAAGLYFVRMSWGGGHDSESILMLK